MIRPLSPAFFLTTALAFLDDDAAAEAASPGLFSPLARRYGLPNGGGDPAASAGIPIESGWSAAFVHHVGYWSHYDYAAGRSVWPLPASASCGELAGFAAAHFLLAADAPQPGDIYLLWSPAKKLFARAGIVLRNIQALDSASGRIRYACLTIDGDTSPRGSLHGRHTAIVQRTLVPARGDRLVRWSLLELMRTERSWSVEFSRRRAA